ncbi:MAG: molybdenum cofactor guanylyltransferase [Acidobacteria bacterium]|nr:molybdenum cofactor guanylyltransferase [Acidobacteriota bacterium]
MHRAGYVLAGGLSSRMGQDKALLPFRGSTLLECVAQTVRQAAGNVTVVGPAQRYSFLGLPLIEDRLAGLGPLSGIHSALSDSKAEWNLVTACDMPNLTPEFLCWLLEEAERRDSSVLMPVSLSGFPEPLCAVYRRTCLACAEEALAEGRLKITDAFSRLRIELVPAGPASLLASANTPEDWASMLKHVEVSGD